MVPWTHALLSNFLLKFALLAFYVPRCHLPHSFHKAILLPDTMSSATWSIYALVFINPNTWYLTLACVSFQGWWGMRCIHPSKYVWFGSMPDGVIPGGDYSVHMQGWPEPSKTSIYGHLALTRNLHLLGERAHAKMGWASSVTIKWVCGPAANGPGEHLRPLFSSSTAGQVVLASSAHLGDSASSVGAGQASELCFHQLPSKVDGRCHGGRR